MSIMLEDGEPKFQIAPMIDVFFVLLLFFMVSAGAMKEERTLTAPLPGRGTGPKDVVPMTLEISGDGQVSFNGVSTDTPTDTRLPQTMARLKAVMVDAPERPIIIQPAATARHQRVMDVLDLCKAVHVHKVLFSPNVE